MASGKERNKRKSKEEAIVFGGGRLGDSVLGVVSFSFWSFCCCFFTISISFQSRDLFGLSVRLTAAAFLYSRPLPPPAAAAAAASMAAPICFISSSVVASLGGRSMSEAPMRTFLGGRRSGGGWERG
jgi:hypothetical protein